MEGVVGEVAVGVVEDVVAVVVTVVVDVVVEAVVVMALTVMVSGSPLLIVPSVALMNTV